MLLVVVASRHGDELTADFQRLYGIPNWRTLSPLRAAALCGAMVPQSESWVHRAMNPDWRWHDPTVALMAAQTDYLALLVWMNSKDGQKNRNRPHPVPRPQVNEPEVEEMPQAGVDIDQLADLLARPRT